MQKIWDNYYRDAPRGVPLMREQKKDTPLGIVLVLLGCMIFGAIIAWELAHYTMPVPPGMH